ncbi:hypothetical protein M2D63_020695 [Pseudomonas sp. BJa5]|uniref:hypothetical protein n=1 Tax=Pseudomonas sp. BJa5 TaxID=2936270 RepID=UPI002559BE3D|nr:hypothetical protein [Pseudomonas sp. BGr12]MDL2423533.1 hypothetical protein [Pseudomonas sp. BGr12]
MNDSELKSPLTIIAILAGIIEASALASLPFLSERSQGIYTWFLVGFPFFLTVLFFLTLNFNYRSLFSPPPVDPGAMPDTHISLAVMDETVVESAGPDRLQDMQPLGEPATPPEQTSITICMRGAQTPRLIELFAAQALKQTQPPDTTWILCNLDAGTRTTLVTRPIAE